MKSEIQCKDLNQSDIINFIKNLDYNKFKGANLFTGYENSIQLAFNQKVPKKILLAKMKKLIKAGLVVGCTCGCRGDFRLNLE